MSVPDRNPSPPPAPRPLVEGLDYYIEAGRWVFTAHYLRERGYCCGNGCRHCPYQSDDRGGKMDLVSENQ
nr:DUF5522 domain-containing protein [Fimbriiglobus ruber]